MSDDRAPIEQLLDVVLYAPLGIALDVQRRLPELIGDGRRQAEQRVVLAKFIGKMAVQVGRKEIEKRIAAFTAPRAEPAPAAETETSAEGPATQASNVTSIDRDPSPEPMADTAPDEAALAIVGYESLSASQVVGRLAALDDDELAAVAAYEAAHRSRRTILAKVAQLRSRGA